MVLQTTGRALNVKDGVPDRSAAAVKLNDWAHNPEKCNFRSTCNNAAFSVKLGATGEPPLHAPTQLHLMYAVPTPTSISSLNANRSPAYIEPDVLKLIMTIESSIRNTLELKDSHVLVEALIMTQKQCDEKAIQAAHADNLAPRQIVAVVALREKTTAPLTRGGSPLPGSSKLEDVETLWHNAGGTEGGDKGFMNAILGSLDEKGESLDNAHIATLELYLRQQNLLNAEGFVMKRDGTKWEEEAKKTKLGGVSKKAAINEAFLDKPEGDGMGPGEFCAFRTDTPHAGNVPARSEDGQEQARSVLYLRFGIPSWNQPPSGALSGGMNTELAELAELERKFQSNWKEINRLNDSQDACIAAYLQRRSTAGRSKPNARASSEEWKKILDLLGKMEASNPGETSSVTVKLEDLLKVWNKVIVSGLHTEAGRYGTCISTDNNRGFQGTHVQPEVVETVAPAQTQDAPVPFPTGTRISRFFPIQNEWFKGTVEKVRIGKKMNYWFIKYDDGDAEDLELEIMQDRAKVKVISS